MFLFIAAVSGQEKLYSYMQIFVELQGVLVVLGNLLSWKCINGFKSWTESRVSSLLPRSSTGETESTNLPLQNMPGTNGI